ncbi:hypothetical protein [uncultured Desulfobacter sp.]|uniref:hypothetical protein n=1 Tax=uncultured Desulfobacter sp. TaxID=240139 RepID=UPI002AAB67B4|nr:hypothetical protein [uncultured Desulfobacter sp.]
METEKIRIKPGEKYKIFFTKNNPNNQTIHIRSIIDDDQVVYRKISKEEQSLSYHIGSVYFFELLQAGGVIKKAG